MPFLGWSFSVDLFGRGRIYEPSPEQRDRRYDPFARRQRFRGFVRKQAQIIKKVEIGGFPPVRPAQFLHSEKFFKILQGNQ
jgi:hypothetical protein